MVIPVASTFVWLQVQKANVRKQVKWQMIHDMDQSRLTSFTFETSQLENLDWKHSKEFEYRGNMYDVVTRKSQGDSTILTCWPDGQETALNHELDKLFQFVIGTDKQSKESKTKTIQFYKSLFCEDLPSNLNPQLDSKRLCNKPQVRIQNPYPSLVSPPPRIS